MITRTDREFIRKNLRNFSGKAQRELESGYGLSFVNHKGNHVKVFYLDQYMGVMAKTPSDYRSADNFCSILCKKMAETQLKQY